MTTEAQQGNGTPATEPAPQKGRYVVFYSLDGGETFRVANDKGKKEAGFQEYVGLGSDGTEAKKEAVAKVGGKLAEAIGKGNEDGKVVLATSPTGSFKPKAPKPVPARTVF